MEIREPASNLEKILRAGKFAVTSELGPPKNADAAIVHKKAKLLRDVSDGANITDNQTAIVRMSSIGAAVMTIQDGFEPIIQMTCRDRNRIAMQSDLLGAYALGVRNVLCLSGDHMRWGNHPEAKKVYDLDSINLIAMVRGMDAGKFQNGEDIKPAPRFFVGGVENPFAPPYEFRPFRLKKKADAGAQFIQTQMIFNVDRFKEFMAKVVDLGLHERMYILAGVGPLKSPGMARYMRDSVAGMEVSPQWVERMEKTPKEKWKDEGINVCVEIIQQMREIPGIAGVHIMSIEWEEAVPLIVERAGLLPRPKPAELTVAQPLAAAA
ncbi:MAG: methylenetetrahydrofolate reductase [Chloroflexi bacterium]|nr:methylenetetrahydrofolate reductase [Chloroflexota bacterium]